MNTYKFSNKFDKKYDGWVRKMQFKYFQNCNNTENSRNACFFATKKKKYKLYIQSEFDILDGPADFFVPSKGNPPPFRIAIKHDCFLNCH